MRSLNAIRRNMTRLAVFFLVAGVVLGTSISSAAVPVRISIKFILNASGNLPGAGRLNTHTEALNELNEGIAILAETMTELSLELVELTDLAGLSQWYSVPPDGTNMNNLKNAALADKATYHWTDGGINIYINGGPGSAASYYPPDNNFILMNQGCTNTPSCILHEIGHSLNLPHTHDDDGCADTLPDNDAWVFKDQMAQNSFGAPFANLNASQQDQVNLTWNNIMSYHNDEPQRRISPCQRDRISDQTDNDRGWLLSKWGIYVNPARASSLFRYGRWDLPFATLQEALSFGGLNNGVIVLESGTYPITQDNVINLTGDTNVEMVTRSGESLVDRGAQSYVLPVELEKSEDPNVRTLVRKAQDEDSLGRSAEREADEALRGAARDSDKDAIREAARTRIKRHRDNSLNYLLQAEKHAKGDELLAIQLELAQRYRDEGNYQLAVKYFQLVAEGTDQKGLKEECLQNIEKYSKKLTEQKDSAK